MASILRWERMGVTEIQSFPKCFTGDDALGDELALRCSQQTHLV